MIRRVAPRSALVLVLAACGGSPPPEPAAPPPAVIAVHDTPPAPPPGEALAVTAEDPTWGDAGALVTLVQFGDFGNGFCAQHAGWLRELRAQCRPDVLRIVWKSAPGEGRPEARTAAAAALAVFAAGGARAFWSFYDAAFATSPEIPAAQLERWAEQAGVRPEAYRRALADARVERKLKDDAAQAEALGVAPPHLLVNGALTMPFRSIDELASLIDAEWDAAEAAVRAGMARARVSGERTRANLARGEGKTAAERARLAAGEEPPPPPEPQQPAGRVMMGAKHLLVMYQGSRRAAAGISRTKAEARARAEEAAKKARQGVPFEDVVRQYSDEPGAAARGGDLGRFPEGAMVREFEDAVRSTPVGSISDVVETPFGFHVLLRTE